MEQKELVASEVKSFQQEAQLRSWCESVPKVVSYSFAFWTLIAKGITCPLEWFSSREHNKGTFGSQIKNKLKL